MGMSRGRGGCLRRRSGQRRPAGSVLCGQGKKPLPARGCPSPAWLSLHRGAQPMGTVVPVVFPFRSCCAPLPWGSSAGIWPLPCPGSLSPRVAWLFPPLSAGLGYRTSQKQHTFPTLLKMAKAAYAIQQAGWGAVTCYFGAAQGCAQRRDRSLCARGLLALSLGTTSGPGQASSLLCCNPAKSAYGPRACLHCHPMGTCIRCTVAMSTEEPAPKEKQ